MSMCHKTPVVIMGGPRSIPNLVMWGTEVWLKKNDSKEDGLWT